jgi:hypothetical protein
MPPGLWDPAQKFQTKNLADHLDRNPAFGGIGNRGSFSWPAPCREKCVTMPFKRQSGYEKNKFPGLKLGKIGPKNHFGIEAAKVAA